MTLTGSMHTSSNIGTSTCTQSLKAGETGGSRYTRGSQGVMPRVLAFFHHGNSCADTHAESGGQSVGMRVIWATCVCSCQGASRWRDNLGK